jgi:carbonic anhydrase
LAGLFKHPLSEAVSQKKLKIVGGVYDLHTGRVDLVSS